MGLRYNPALDGLRAIACLLVLFHHTRVPWFQAGNLGVEVFFVLSGYLITRVIAETQPTLAQFYLRRFRRLMPALALMVGTYLAVALALGIAHAGRDSLAVLLYVADVTKLLWGWPDYLGHAWSLGIEEKFYLLWPLVFMAWKPSRRVLLLAFVLATMWRFAHYGTDACRLRFDLHLSGLLLGCALANAPRVRTPAWPALLVIGACTYLFYSDTPNLRLYGVTLVELATALLLIGQQPAWLGWKPLAYVGKLSYGIYLWHYPIALLVHERVGGTWWQQTVVVLVLSIGLAALSFHTIEAFFRQRHKSALIVQSA